MIGLGSVPVRNPAPLLSGAAAVGLSTLIHALALVWIWALPRESPSTKSFPVELVPDRVAEAPPSPAPAMPPRATKARAARRVQSKIAIAPRRRLERLRREPLQPGPSGTAAGPDQTLLASAGEGSPSSVGVTTSGPPSAGRPERSLPPPQPPLSTEGPRLLESPPPVYPLAARRRRAEGLVLVRARVGPRGEVVDAMVARTSGAKDLDRAALEAVRSWRFHPGTRGSEPVWAWVNVPVRFRLAGS